MTDKEYTEQQITERTKEVYRFLQDVYRNATNINLTPEQALEEYKIAGDIAGWLLHNYEWEQPE